MSDTLRQNLQASLGTAYTIERELGGGGMSRVYVATERALGRQVVIKLLPPDLAAGVSTERFKREIQLAARLQHPHIVPLLTAGESDGLPYFTMPYVEGESLRVRLAKRGEMPVAEAIRVLREIASALAYAHAHGVVHRDIKPENVLLSGGAAMVTDFGVAKALSASTTAEHGVVTSVGVALGTPAYMAPEQASADPSVDHRADVYAFGILAYELLTGHTPFGGRAPRGLLAAHVTEAPEPIQKRRASLPPGLSALVMRCLEKRPADRPQSAEEIVHALDDLATPSGGTPSTLAAATTTTPYAGGRRVILGATVVVVVLALAVAAYTWRTRGVVRTADAAPLTLAVLPFDNAGPDDQASFTDGLTDAVTAKLSALPTLAVIDRRSSAQYRASTKPAKQIGAELGVSFLLEGVVRWAKDRTGVWRAQVTPTLIDARTGTTKWTGEPVIMAPDDPFSAQSAIATKVVDALEVALRPTDRAALLRPFSNDPEAFASYERGQAIATDARRTPSKLRRAIAEYARAVELDSTFAEAWVGLQSARTELANLLPGDRDAEEQARSILDQALVRFPGHPHLLLQFASLRLDFDHDTLGLDTLVRRALIAAPNDVSVLTRSARLLQARQQFDSAHALIARAAQLDPRSPATLAAAWRSAANVNRWDDALPYADALIALDSTDERGWVFRVLVATARGDTTAMQRELSRAMAVIPHPTRLLGLTPYAGDELARRFLRLSARELGVANLADSVSSYLDGKADACARLANTACERVYYDSMATLLTNRPLSGADELGFLSMLALAQAALGRERESRGTLDRLFALRRRTASRSDGAGGLDATVIAGTYARLGQPDSAVRWLEQSLITGNAGYTAKSIEIAPKLWLLRGTPEFQRFLRVHAR